MNYVPDNWLMPLQDRWPGDRLFPKNKLLRLKAASPWAATQLQQADDLGAICTRMLSKKAGKRIELDKILATAGLEAGLRHYRNTEMLRIIWRDLNANAKLESSLNDLSDLADMCLHAALEKLQQALISKHGDPETSSGDNARFGVLAMGKLGGRELNLSSDIDLIFFHTGHGLTRGNGQGRGKISNEQFFTRLGRGLINTLSAVTANGFVFRVDTRLRPHGRAGILVPSLAALEQYYQNEGRDWERYALIKARPVAGDLESGAALLTSLRPFIFRRYLDYGAVESLREMHQLIRIDADKAVKKSTLGIDIKRGSGGIREAEFFVQFFQLLRGGRDQSLRQTNFLNSLEAVSHAALIDAQQATKLAAAYRYLRLLENRIQAIDDQQTHHLPASEAKQDCLLAAMQAASWPALLASLARHQACVKALFSGLFAKPLSSADAQTVTFRYQALLNADWTEAGLLLNESELAQLQPALARLEQLPMGKRARTRTTKLLEKVLQYNQQTPLELVVWLDLLIFIQAVSRRSAYLALLIEHPGALHRLLQLFSRSDWLSAKIIRYPVLLDDLIDPKLNQPADKTQMRARMQYLLKTSEEDETLLEGINQYKRSQHLRLAIAQLSGELASQQAQYKLAELADIIIETGLHAIRKTLEQRHGKLPGLQFCIVAYGSLGAREMTYASDLDLVFLYQNNPECATQKQSSGPRAIGIEQYASRLGQRLIAFLTTLTPAGRLYSVDSRLRPNGKAGTLVSHFDAFTRYQNEQAWVWEFQALSRARAMVGDSQLLKAFERTRIQVLQKKPAPDLRQQIVEMREKMHQQASTQDLYKQIKNAPGGLTDIEFIAQYGVLKNAHTRPELLTVTDSYEQLEKLNEAGLIDSAETLISAWQLLSHKRLMLKIERQADQYQDPEIIAAMKSVQACWQRLMVEKARHSF